MRLLVAVSNEPLAHAIHGALLAGRHEVSLASTGSIALAAVAKESFDAVILDESLLGISTEQLIESLRNARASVKILLLTSTPLSKTIGEGSRWRALPVAGRSRPRAPGAWPPRRRCRPSLRTPPSPPCAPPRPRAARRPPEQHQQRERQQQACPRPQAWACRRGRARARPAACRPC